MALRRKSENLRSDRCDSIGSDIGDFNKERTQLQRRMNVLEQAADEIRSSQGDVQSELNQISVEEDLARGLIGRFTNDVVGEISAQVYAWRGARVSWSENSSS